MIYLVRHGETELNKKKVLQGRSDSPLNEAGITQAEKVRDYFLKEGIHFDRIYSSPLKRAVQTAQIIAGDQEIIIDDHLLEMDYGPFEGSSLKNPSPEIIHFFSDFVKHPAPEGMESLSSVVKRLGDFLEVIRADRNKYADQYEDSARKNQEDQTEQHTYNNTENILISTHAIALKGALEYLTPESQGAYWSKFIGNCAVYQTDIVDDRYLIPVETI